MDNACYAPAKGAASFAAPDLRIDGCSPEYTTRSGRRVAFDGAFVRSHAGEFSVAPDYKTCSALCGDERAEGFVFFGEVDGVKKTPNDTNCLCLSLEMMGEIKNPDRKFCATTQHSASSVYGHVGGPAADPFRDCGQKPLVSWNEKAGVAIDGAGASFTVEGRSKAECQELCATKNVCGYNADYAGTLLGGEDCGAGVYVPGEGGGDSSCTCYNRSDLPPPGGATIPPQEAPSVIERQDTESADQSGIQAARPPAVERPPASQVRERWPEWQPSGLFADS